MEKRRVVITGLGTVNPLGNNTADSWAAARAGKCGIGPITQFDTSEFKCKLAGEVKGFDPETVVDKKDPARWRTGQFRNPSKRPFVSRSPR